MKPPYDITTEILRLCMSISEKIGAIDASLLDRRTPQLRKQNHIKSIHSSLSIEGNTLTEEQITALIENKRVIGPKKDIIEVLNAIKVYEELRSFDPFSDKSYLKAHKTLMEGLVASAGKYRTKSVGIVNGSEIQHLAPSHEMVPGLMKDLFNYLKNSDDLILIKSCVFHYEMEFIHPFLDGNGRMGRLWQTLILMDEYPVFESLPFESLILKSQAAYYRALSLSDKSGKSTFFIEYMLDVIDRSLAELLNYNNRTLSDIDRIAYFVQGDLPEFSRKDYMDVFKDISTATASRDLKKGIELNLIESQGSHNKTRYQVRNKS